jgi:hypothetical protein
MSETNFILKKVKLTSEGKVEVIYHEPDHSMGAATKNVITITSDRTPHPDLTLAIKALTPYLADCNSLRSHRQLEGVKLNKSENTALTAVEEIFAKLDQKVFSAVIPTGIDIKGDEDNTRVIITGKHTTGNTAVALNSPNISLNGDTWGFEQGIADALEVIKEEVRAFVIEKKSAQLQMQFDQEAEKVA